MPAQYLKMSKLNLDQIGLKIATEQPEEYTKCAKVSGVALVHFPHYLRAKTK